ncbi:MAG: hypothetical protein HC806_04885, partial [Anaerolineae bacterium]|nr:hypothetical protein [Anaerolineae bacterium]
MRRKSHHSKIIGITVLVLFLAGCIGMETVEFPAPTGNSASPEARSSLVPPSPTEPPPTQTALPLTPSVTLPPR